MSEKVTIQVGNVQTIKRSSDYKVYYANQSRVRVTPTDLQLFFGTLADEVSDGSVFNNEEFSLILSPQHAKILSQALATTVQAYESQHGEIKIAQSAAATPDEIRNAIAEALLKASQKK